MIPTKKQLLLLVQLSTGRITFFNFYSTVASAQSHKSPGPCDMVDGTATTITGLQCNTSYMVSVRAVNCVGVGSSLQMSINLRPPGMYINYSV